ncbi:MAG: hypothetical protein ABIK79_00415 [Chloroflexota bacterium]
MPVSNRELEALKIVHRYGGQVGSATVAQAMSISTDYARSVCTGLGKADYIDMANSGLCRITPKGMNELTNRGLIQPSDQGGAQGEKVMEPPTQLAGPGIPRRQAAEPGQMVDVKCVYCWGRGTDPFGCPSPTSICSVCGGKGLNRVMAPYVPCPDCGGTGKQPGRRLTCSACKGKGVTTVREPVGRLGLPVRSAMPTPSGTAVRDAGPSRITSVRAATPTSPGTAMKGRARARTLPRPPQVVSAEERASAYIANFPGVRVEDVEALLDLSQSKAKKALQILVKAGKIKKKDELYYPA